MLPSLIVDSHADLKIEQGTYRLWLEKKKHNPKALVEKKINGLWGVIREYRPKKSQEGFDYHANPDSRWEDVKEGSVRALGGEFKYRISKFNGSSKKIKPYVGAIEIEGEYVAFNRDGKIEFDSLEEIEREIVKFIKLSVSRWKSALASNPRKEEKVSKAPIDIYICVSNEAGREKFFGLISELPQYMYDNLLDENSGWMATAYRGTNKEFREAKADSRYHHASHSASKIMEEVTLGDFL